MPLDEILPLHNQDDIRESVQSITELIDQEVESHNGDHSKVFVGGFSQGGSAAIATFLLYKSGQLGGCAVHSGAHLAIIDYANEVDLDLKRKTHMCLYHGEEDPTVTLNLTQRTFAIFDELKLNYSLTLEAELKHKISEKGVKHISEYLTRHMQ